MKLLHSLPPYNFPGVEEPDFAKAKFVVLPVPYDGTASYGTGAKDGPHAIIAASRFLELHDRELGGKLAGTDFFTLDELEPARGDAKETTKRVRDAVSEIFARKKTPVTLGGDHSIAIGAIQAAASHFDNLSVVAFDAHLDCWGEFEGSSHSHASVGARIADITQSVAKARLNEVIIGARTAGKNEIDFCRKNGVEIVWAEEAKKDIQRAVKKILPKLKKNVYMTFDFDCLDPSIMPAVGTPEPEGLQFGEAVEALKLICASKNVIGMDFCELAPMPGNRGPDFLAAKLVYKACGLASKNK